MFRLFRFIIVFHIIGHNLFEHTCTCTVHLCMHTLSNIFDTMYVYIELYRHYCSTGIIQVCGLPFQIEKRAFLATL